MPDYEKLYHLMFNAATDAERQMSKSLRFLEKPNVFKIIFAMKAFQKSRKILIAAQQKCEEIYMWGDKY